MSDREDAPRACLQKAVDLLARRPHFRAQLAAKLAGRGFDEEIVGAALERLQELGYLDERRTVEDFVSRRLERSAVGSRRLRADLLRRGAAADVVDAVLAEHRDSDRPDAVRQAAAAWLARGKRDPRALARFLDRQGFPGHAIFEVVRELEADLS
ncbi:MAG: regulatory protein RecX [Acidobacteriota bacterium]